MELLWFLIIGTCTALWRTLSHLAAFVAGAVATWFWRYDQEALPTEKE